MVWLKTILKSTYKIKVPKRKRRPWALTKLLSKPTCLCFGQNPSTAKGEEKVPLTQHIFPFSTAALAQESGNMICQSMYNKTLVDFSPVQNEREAHEDKSRACTDLSHLIFIAYSPCSRHSGSSRWFWSTFQTQGLMTLSPHSGRLYAWCSTSPSWNFVHISFLLWKFNFIISISWLENKWGNRVALVSQMNLKIPHF